MILFKFNNKKELILFIIGFIPIIIIGGISTYILANPIIKDLQASVTKYILIAMFISLVLFVLMLLFKLKNKKKLMIGIIVAHLILSGVGIYLVTLYVRAGNVIDDATNQKTTANFYIVALKDSNIKADNLTGKKIASMDTSFWGDVDVKQIMADDKKNPIQLEKLDTLTVINYLEASEMLEAGTVDLILIDNIGFAQIEAVNPEFMNKIEKLLTFSYPIASTEGSGINISQEPFTVLLAGLDNRTLDGETDINKGRTDAIIIATFNPKTMRVLMVSVPRDTYLPIACQNNYRDKITHAGINGIGCTVSSLENAFSIPIDYFVVMNFDSVVAIVDALGGIEVDVPIAFCEQNSVGAYGEAEICLQTGVQKLNGQQALALARHRKTVNDIIRGKNQMLVIQAIVQTFAQNASKLSITEMLSIVEGNFKTNFNENQFGQFMTLARNIGFDSVFSPTSSLLMEKMTLETSGDMINGASVQIAYLESINSITFAMNQVSGREPASTPTTFAFDPNVAYTNMTRQPVTPSATPSVSEADTYVAPSFPNFTGQTLSQVRSWCHSIGGELKNTTISCSFLNKQGQATSQDQALFVSATVSAGSRLTSSQTITFTFQEVETKPAKIDVQNFIGQKAANASAWCNLNGIYCNFTQNGNPSTNPDAIIKTQNPSSGQAEVGSTISFTVEVEPVAITIPTSIATVGDAITWANANGVSASFTLNGVSVLEPTSTFAVVSPGGTVLPGGNVSFALSGVTIVPNFVGKTVAQAKAECANLTCTFNPTVTNETTNIVTGSSLTAGQIVSIGAAITLTISTN